MVLSGAVKGALLGRGLVLLRLLGGVSFELGAAVG